MAQQQQQRLQSADIPADRLVALRVRGERNGFFQLYRNHLVTVLNIRQFFRFYLDDVLGSQAARLPGDDPQRLPVEAIVALHRTVFEPYRQMTPGFMSVDESLTRHAAMQLRFQDQPIPPPVDRWRVRKFELDLFDVLLDRSVENQDVLLGAIVTPPEIYSLDTVQYRRTDVTEYALEAGSLSFRISDPGNTCFAQSLIVSMFSRRHFDTYQLYLDNTLLTGRIETTLFGRDDGGGIPSALTGDLQPYPIGGVRRGFRMERQLGTASPWIYRRLDVNTTFPRDLYAHASAVHEIVTGFREGRDECPILKWRNAAGDAGYLWPVPPRQLTPEGNLVDVQSDPASLFEAMVRNFGVPLDMLFIATLAPFQMGRSTPSLLLHHIAPMKVGKLSRIVEVDTIGGSMIEAWSLLQVHLLARRLNPARFIFDDLLDPESYRATLYPAITERLLEEDLQPFIRGQHFIEALQNDFISLDAFLAAAKANRSDELLDIERFTPAAVRGANIFNREPEQALSDVASVNVAFRVPSHLAIELQRIPRPRIGPFPIKPDERGARESQRAFERRVREWRIAVKNWQRKQRAGLIRLRNMLIPPIVLDERTAPDLLPWIEEEEEPGTKLVLYAVMIHQGLDASSGHIISYIRSAEPTQWHKFDNQGVFIPSEADIIGRAPMMSEPLELFIRDSRTGELQWNLARVLDDPVFGEHFYGTATALAAEWLSIVEFIRPIADVQLDVVLPPVLESPPFFWPSDGIFTGSMLLFYQRE